MVPGRDPCALRLAQLSPRALRPGEANDDIDCMELRHLRYFVGRRRGTAFSRAAIRVGIEQSPLSPRAIRALECDVGARLLERSTRGSRLTLAGEIFLQHCANHHRGCGPGTKCRPGSCHESYRSDFELSIWRQSLHSL